MPEINLINEYSTRLDERFKQKSLTEAHCGHDYSWDGLNSITVFSLNNMEVHDYGVSADNDPAATDVLTNRFTNGNAPTNIGDQITTYVLQQKKSFSGVIDGVTNMDQKNIKKANALLKQTWDEVMVPLIDKYRFNTWINGAGLSITNANDLTNTKGTNSVVRAILLAQSALNNKFVPRDGRVCFIKETLSVETKLAEELGYNANFTGKAIVNGECARMGGLPIVSVPDDWMPAGVNFFIKYKRATADPTKLKMLRALSQVQGIYGTVLEGLTRFDSFVLANKANGIIVHAKNGIAVEPAATLSSSKIVLASSGATAIKYTTDGSNPKTSPTAHTYSSPLTVEAGKILRAYATKTGSINSSILTIAESDVKAS